MKTQLYKVVYNLLYTVNNKLLHPQAVKYFILEWWTWLFLSLFRFYCIGLTIRTHWKIESVSRMRDFKEVDKWEGEGIIIFLFQLEGFLRNKDKNPSHVVDV